VALQLVYLVFSKILGWIVPRSRSDTTKEIEIVVLKSGCGAALTVERVERLLPEPAGRIVRHELPHLCAVHLVLTGLLGSVGSSNLRIDQIGTSVDEYLRAKHLLGPSAA
jgi:hypothetical protein